MTAKSVEDREATLAEALRQLERGIRLVREAADRPTERAAYAADLVRLSKGVFAVARGIEETNGGEPAPERMRAPRGGTRSR